MKKFTTVFIVSLLLGTGLFAQKTPVVGVIDVQRVLNDYAAFKAAREKIEGSIAPVQEEIKKMEAKIEAIKSEGREAETSAQNPALSEEARATAQQKVGELMQQMQKAFGELQQFQQQAQQLAQRGQQEQLQPLNEKAIEAVKTVAQDKGIDLVVPKNTVLYSSDALEISDAVIAVLNAGE